MDKCNRIKEGFPIKKENADWLVIANPLAGNGRLGREWRAIYSLLEVTGFSFEWRFTTHRCHATELAQLAIEGGYRKLLAIGGDGTNHEVTNGIFRQAAVPSQEVRYGLIPVGSGNDWSKTYKIPKNWRKWIPMIKEERVQLQDVGLVTYVENGQEQSRYFVNVAGMGYDAFIVKKVEEKGGAQNAFRYFSMIFKCLLAYEHQHGQLIFPGQQLSDRFYTIHVGIGKYSGGGMTFVPHARPNSGTFAITTIGEITKPGVLMNTYRLYNGTIGKHPKVQTYQSKALSVESLGKHPIAVEADGEYLGVTPVTFSISGKKLNVIVPPKD